MKVEDIMAVVVSYNGGEMTRKTILALVEQVGNIHVVDNGSEPESIEILDSLVRQQVISLDRLGTNHGIGYALNLGVARARSIGCTWLLTMDQDSVADSGLIKAYQAAALRDRKAAVFSPRVFQKLSAADAVSVEVTYAITSGNLVQINVFDQIGLYDEGFFIDCIDFDFSLRLRRAGYKLLRVQNAEMQHQLGEPTRLPTYITKFYAQHSSRRRYYMTRNYLYMAERHFLRFPGFFIKLGILRILLFVLILFFDRNPLRSYSAIVKGIRDYVARRDGPCPGASS